MSDMLTELLIECSEGLDLIDRHLVTLELEPANDELLTEIFRALHTIKGSCGFYGLDRLEQVAHSAENLLTLLRAGDLTFSKPIADALLTSVDTFRSILATVEDTGGEGNPDVSALTSRLDALATNTGAEDQPATEATPQRRRDDTNELGPADPIGPEAGRNDLADVD
ncbi:MAG: Hpt domain-containing protein, partial [Actinomycetota bacterium]